MASRDTHTGRPFHSSVVQSLLPFLLGQALQQLSNQTHLAPPGLFSWFFFLWAWLPSLGPAHHFWLHQVGPPSPTWLSLVAPSSYFRYNPFSNSHCKLDIWSYICLVSITGYPCIQHLFIVGTPMSRHCERGGGSEKTTSLWSRNSRSSRWVCLTLWHACGSSSSHLILGRVWDSTISRISHVIPMPVILGAREWMSR